MITTVLMNLLTPFNLLLMIGGTVMGVIFGAIPGLSNTGGMALLLPISFVLKPASAIILMSSIYIGGLSGGLVSAILIGVPGAPSNIATTFDGYPLAKQGKAGLALGVATFSSMIATFASVFIAMLATKPLAKVAVLLGPWEMFSLCTAAIVLVVTISKGNMFAGLTSAAFGLLIAMVGVAPVDGAKRFTFGSSHLVGGISMLGVMLGIFAIAGLGKNFAEGQMSCPPVDDKEMTGIGLSMKEYWSHWKVILKSFFIGLWIGFLPGLGAGLSNVVAYASVKAGSKEPETFGKGNIEGVLASEVSNNAAVGGAIVPTIALGIPGDTSCAILLSCLMIQGIEAGPLLMDSNTDLVYTFFGVLLLSTVVTFLIEWFGVRLFPKILQAPFAFLYSAIFMICITGIYSNSSSLWTCGLSIAMTAIGILMAYADMSMSPFILGYILGPMMEKYMRMGMTYSTEGFVIFLKRPISLAFLLVAAGFLFWPMIRSAREKRKREQGIVSVLDKVEAAASGVKSGEE